MIPLKVGSVLTHIRRVTLADDTYYPGGSTVIRAAPVTLGHSNSGYAR